MNKFFGHLHTINKHHRLVFKHCRKAGIFFQGMFHDMSKYSRKEFFISVKCYQGNRSPNEKERETLGYSGAWLHHKGRNPHHFEYWYDYDAASHSYKPIKMPIKYVKEMFCDRLAASKVYKGKDYNITSAKDYFITHQTACLMHPKTAELLMKWFGYLEQYGEKETFKKIKNEKNY